MATPLSAGYACRLLKQAGVKVVTYDGWQTHNRNQAGPWGPVHGVLVHHFGPYSTEAGAIALAREGRSDLPGPLYNVLVGRNGTVHLIGWGRANHAGMVDGDVLDAIADERQLPAPNADTEDGNAALYGVCLINEGNGQAYPTVQLDAAAAVCAALCRGHDGWTAKSIARHRDVTTRKPIDPRIDLTAFRKRANRLWDGLPPAQESSAGEGRPTLAQRVMALERQVQRLVELEAKEAA